MPWSRRSRCASSQPFLIFALPIALAGCVTVASTPELPTFPPASPTPEVAAASPTAEPLAPPTASLASPTAAIEASQPPAVAAVPDPAPQTSAPTATVAPVATPVPTRSPTPAPTQAPTPTVTAASAPAGTPLETEAPRAAATTGNARLDRATRRKLQRVLDDHVTNKGVAGLQAAVRLPSGETWVGTAGNAEFTPQRAIRDDTQFAIASVTKTFVAALILSLVDEGRIDLDAPFGTYFDDAPRSKTATIRQLLSHTSGIYNYFANPRYGQAAEAWLRSAPTGLNSRQHKWTYDEIMDLVKGGYCKPGECYTYSNTNYVILGKVAEAVGGAPIHAQLKQRFFMPLGLDDTVYQPAQRPRTDAAHGHWKNVGSGYNDHTREARVLPFMAAVTVADAAGAIASTARDLSVWASALYGGEVLSPESTREMTTILRAGTYGLGTDVALFAGNRGYGHRGGLRGFESSMWHFPDSGVSVVLLSNQGNWLTDVPMQKLVRTALGKG